MAGLPDFMAGFSEDDLNVDFGFSAVTADDLGIQTGVEAAVSPELEAKLDKILEAQAATADVATQKAALKAEIEKERIGLAKKWDDEKTVLSGKLAQVEKLVLPLLYNLIRPETLDKKYILWPNRKTIIEQQIKRILSVTRS